jgi:hypothetical protein
MSSGNRELDAILDQLARQRRARLKGSDIHRLRYIGRLIQSGITEMQQARRLLGDLVEELQRRGQEEPAGDL